LTSKNLDDNINNVRVSKDQALLNLKNDYINNKANNKQGEGGRIVYPKSLGTTSMTVDGNVTT
jgi:hypothetical protein